MFLVEGLPSIALALLAWFAFPDSPREARWLSDDERTWLAANVHAAAKPEKGEPGRWAVLRNPMMWLCSGLWFCLLAGNYGVIFWLPQVIHSLTGFGPLAIGVIGILPWVGVALGMYFNAQHQMSLPAQAAHFAQVEL